jgi:GPH family glycoside/pentoside/hexuronide:cation symporter
MLTIPGMAMLVEVTDDYHERSTLMSYRVFGNSLGVLVGSMMPAWLLVEWGATRAGHARMSWVVAAILLVAGITSVILLRHTPATVAVEAPRRLRAAGLGRQFLLAWANRPFRVLATAHIFILVGTTFMSVANAYFTRYVLQRTDNWLSTFFLLSTVGSLVSMPLWLWVARRHGKKLCYVAGMAGFGLVHLTWALADRTEPYALLVTRALFGGVAAAGLILFAYSMLSDAIRYDYITTGLRREGSFAGLTSLLAIGVFLSLMGYAASTAGAQATQSPLAVRAIYLSFTVVPGVAMLCGILAMRGYRLDERALQEELVGSTSSR